MKAVRRVCLAAATMLVLSASTLAIGQATAPSGSIPAAARNVQTAAEIQQYKPAITAFVNAHVTALTSADPKARSNARDAIIQQVPTAALPIYLQEFAKAINDAALPAFANAGPAEKVILSVTVAKVAERAMNTSLAPVVRQMLKDPSDAVVLWAVKAAQPMVPVLAGNSLDPNVALITEVTDAAIKRSGNQWIVDEAYLALTLAKRDNTLAAPQVSAMVKIVLPEVQKLFASRLAAWAKGVPPLPTAETRATAFFVSSEVWKRSLTPAQQFTVVQNITDLLNAATNQFAANASARGEIAPLVKLIASAFWVVGDNVGNQPVKAASTVLATINAGTAPATVSQNTASMLNAVVAVPAFTQLKGVPTPAPAPAAAAAATAANP